MKIKLIKGEDFVWRIVALLTALIGSLVVADFVIDCIASAGVTVINIIIVALMLMNFYMVWQLIKDFIKHHIRRAPKLKV